MKKKLETVIVEQSGEISTMKAIQIAQLVEAYAKAHPELLEEFEKRSAKGGESGVGADF